MNTWLRQSYYTSGDTIADIQARMCGLISDLSLDHFSIGVLKLPSNIQECAGPEVYTSYPKEWISRYSSRQYLKLDPVCDLTLKSTRPFYWGQGRFLRSFRKQQRSVFLEAREFQIMNGLCIPVRGSRGEISTFNVVSSNKKHLQEVVRSEHERLFQAAFDTHDLVIAYQHSNANSSQSLPELTLREKECLLWTLDGKTADEVAKLLNLSVFTVNHHASTAAQKLGCTSKHHAAIQALRAGLI